jgi:hypothetical protein
LRNPFRQKLLRRLLTAYAVMALEHDGRIKIPLEERVRLLT